MSRRFAAWCTLWALCIFSATATADDRPLSPAPNVANKVPQRFALIIGVNHSVDAGSAALRFADDDAAQYARLFASVGIATTVLTDLDPDSRRLFPDVALVAKPPTRTELTNAVQRIANDVAAARSNGNATSFFIIYAGHGNANAGVGYITLSDARLTGAALKSDILVPIAATTNHLIVDACYSFLLTARGPSGTRRPLSGFASVGVGFEELNTGLLLSTSSARESHEWDAIEGGIFSYQLRSGLSGAADADNDGLITYRELAAFIDRANAAIINPRFRPSAFIHGAKSNEPLFDLRSSQQNALIFSGAAPQHVVIEDTHGVKIAEFHRSATQTVRIARRGATDALYVTDVEHPAEYLIAASAAPTDIALQPPLPPRFVGRGAQHDILGRLFELPFDMAFASNYIMAADAQPTDVWVPATMQSDTPQKRRIIGGVLIGTGSLLVAVAAQQAWVARDLQHQITVKTSNFDVIAKNQQTRLHNRVTIAAGVGAAALIGSGLVLWLWPSSGAQPLFSANSIGLAASATF
jgi:hypothetical protein